MAKQPYILQVNLESKPCLVVGGGAIALHKTRALVMSGAQVTVVSSSFHDRFDDLDLAARLDRRFEDEDIAGMYLVHAATNHPEVNHHIAELCADAGILCCVADDTSKGTFGAPALLDLGALRVAVSTNGFSPSYGARLRRMIAENVPDHIDDYLNFLGGIRDRSKVSIPDLQLRMRFNAYFASDEGEHLFESSDDEALETIVAELLDNPTQIPEYFTPRWD
jgi:siroheme synthase-like protein